MKLHELKPNEGSTQRKKRVGRGISAGQGKTAGRGTKGYGARSGSGGKLYREGGQLPFVRRLPFKRGFTNIRRIEYREVNLEYLNEVFEAGAEVSPESLSLVGVMKAAADAPVVVLGRGELTKALTFKVHRVSKTAREKIEAAGGSIEILPPWPKPNSGQ